MPEPLIPGRAMTIATPERDTEAADIAMRGLKQILDNAGRPMSKGGKLVLCDLETCRQLAGEFLAQAQAVRKGGA